MNKSKHYYTIDENLNQIDVTEKLNKEFQSRYLKIICSAIILSITFILIIVSVLKYKQFENQSILERISFFRKNIMLNNMCLSRYYEKEFLIIQLDSIKKSKITYVCSYYGDSFQNKPTASGEIFDKNKLTCAGDSIYKIGERLLVTNIETNKSITVRVNDRGDFKKYNRELDLSERAFKEISNLKKGIINCKIKKI